MYLIKTVGIDLAKLVFSIHGIDAHDKCRFRKIIKKNNMLSDICKLPPCIISMEACSGAHYWAREFTMHCQLLRVTLNYLYARTAN